MESQESSETKINFYKFLVPISATLFFFKIFGIAKISWFWVFAPLTVPLGIWALMLAVVLVMSLVLPGTWSFSGRGLNRKADWSRKL